MAEAGAATGICVLGGGIVGAALTYYLTREGRAPVTQYDWRSGRSATTRNGGILTYVGWSGWDLDLLRESAAAYRELSDEVGAGGFEEAGGLRIARTEPDRTWLRQMHEWLQRWAIPSELLDAPAARPRWPQLDLPDDATVHFAPRDATFSADACAAAFSRMATELGAESIAGRSPATVSRSPDGWSVSTPQRTFTTSRVVLACGAWTKGILEELGLSLPLAPFRAQVALLRTAPLLGALPAVHDLDLEVYLRRAPGGRLLVGDGTERNEADPQRARYEADPGFLERAQAAVAHVLPELQVRDVEASWAGLCVASPDAYPVVGRVPGAPGLTVASGWNGLGAMRAPAIARRLAGAIANGTWESLGPADPGRLSGQSVALPLRPEFPLERLAPGALPSDASGVESPGPLPPLVTAGDVRVRTLSSVDEALALPLPPLSEWFDPFLPQFLADAIRTGGSAEVAEVAGRPLGVYLFSPVEGIGSVFTPSRRVAARLLAHRPPGGVYSDRPWLRGGEPIAILAIGLGGWRPSRPFRHPVRLAGREDLPRAAALMHEVTGSVDDRWFATLPRSEEVGFLCEVGGRLAGMSWATVVGEHARGHSFMVHPRFRSLGIGTDLLQARTLWLQDRGVRQIVSEVYDGNVASLRATDRAGMAVVATMYHYAGRRLGTGTSLTSAEPRTSGS